jgi:tetratricopeptide (TPR) repeat protein
MKTHLACMGIAMFLIIFSSCKKEDNSIPKLLTRHEKLRHGAEWDQVQTTYSKLKKNISEKENITNDKIKLAHLFIQEARVTGEHGHYYPAALTLTKEVLSLPTLDNNTKFSALATKAGVELSQHDFTTALETGKAAIKINPYNAQIYGVMVDAYVELGKYKEALAFADKMVAIRPDLRSYSRVSYLREIHGDIIGAKQAMEMAINAGYPGHDETAWAMHTYTEFLMRYNEDDNAKKLCDIILKERNEFPFTIANQADLLVKQNEFRKAEPLYKSAIAIIPEVGFYVSLAEIYKTQFRTKELEEIKKEILVMLQDDVNSGHNMDLEYAYVYEKLFDDDNKAIEYAKKEFKKRPENIDVNRVLAHLYVKQSNKDMAQLHLKKASITNSKHPDLNEIKKYISNQIITMN